MCDKAIKRAIADTHTFVGKIRVTCRPCGATTTCTTRQWRWCEKYIIRCNRGMNNVVLEGEL